MERAKKKLVLDHLVIQTLKNKNLETQTSNQVFDKKELSSILKFGAASLFEDDESQPIEVSPSPSLPLSLPLLSLCPLMR